MPTDTTPQQKNQSHLLPNEREISHEEWLRFFENNRSLIIGGIVLILVSAVGYGFWRVQEDSKISQASAELVRAKTPEQYQEIAKNYSGTRPALIALLTLGDLQFKQNQWDQANQTYQAIIDQYPSSPFRASAMIGQAAVLDATGKLPEAIQKYESVARDFPKTFQAPQALYAAARLKERTGKNKEARQTYEELLTQYPESAWVQDATAKVQKLSAIVQK